MAEVKRYDIDEQIRMRGEGNCDELVQEVEFGDYVLHSDYARLERERDELAEELEATEDELQGCMEELTRLRTERDQALAAHAEMVREIEASQAEMVRLRAVEAAVNSVLNSEWKNDGHAKALAALAEACGRKGP